ncbi:mitochondrial ribosomal death-associated protein 3-domain-containing protein [Mycena rebaudengoi]|nr:mitochondrial ribosomal death-associated protein 3-domain-containing protein [Mycena rebaudengoi]
MAVLGVSGFSYDYSFYWCYGVAGGVYDEQLRFFLISGRDAPRHGARLKHKPVKRRVKRKTNDPEKRGAPSPLRHALQRRPTVYMSWVLSKPCSLAHDTTPSVIRALESKASFSSFMINGRPGTGKSFLLLQAAEYAKATGWISISRGKSLVDSLATQTYLQRFANGTTAVSAGAGLSALAAAGTADPAAAPAVVEHLLAELAAHARFPVLLAIDDFQALYGRSLYCDPFFRFVRPHYLSMPRLLLEYASGRRAFARGVVLGALARSDPHSPGRRSSDGHLGRVTLVPRARARAHGRAVVRDAVHRPLYVHEHGSGEDPDEYAAGKRMAGQVPRRAPTTLMHALRMPDKLNTTEALTLFELWRARGKIQFMAKYTESSGNPRAFVWGGLVGTLQTGTMYTAQKAWRHVIAGNQGDAETRK